MADVREIYTQFKKKELVEVVEELEIDVDQTTPLRNIAEAILKDLEENGIPEDLSDISDTLFQLLIVAEYVDEDGNVIVKEVEPEESEEDALEEIPDWFCFSYYDSRDPACNKCKLAARCKPARIAKRPECFGLLYNPNEPECQMCIEAPFCKKELEKTDG